MAVRKSRAHITMLGLPGFRLREPLPVSVTIDPTAHITGDKFKVRFDELPTWSTYEYHGYGPTLQRALNAAAYSIASNLTNFIVDRGRRAHGYLLYGAEMTPERIFLTEWCVKNDREYHEAYWSLFERLERQGK